MVCNSGASLVPTLDGKLHHFYHVGIHDALFVMQDAESKTLWNHITGEAMYGPLVGRTVGPVSNLLHMTVKQALELDPDTRVAISDQTYFAGGRRLGTATRGPAVGGSAGGRGRGRGPSPDNRSAQMADRFAATLGKEDLRRPRMDIGLGIWNGSTARYYPMERIRARGEAFIDRFDGRTILIYVEPESNTPAALFINATSATRDGLEVRLDGGSTVRSGVLIDRNGQRQPVERPQQIFTRWYGFALTFPGCELFGE